MKPGRRRAKRTFGMLFTDVTDLALSDPQAAVAIATGDLVSVAFAFVIVGFLVGLGQIGLVVYGIKKMSDGNKDRAAQHKETMQTEADRHQEAMGAQKAARSAEADRHQEAMDAERNRHEQAMKALNALIRNTRRRNRPVHAR